MDSKATNHMVADEALLDDFEEYSSIGGVVIESSDKLSIFKIRKLKL